MGSPTDSPPVTTSQPESPIPDYSNPNPDISKLSPAEQQKALAELQPLVEKGTQPDAANFQDFEPLLDAQGRMIGLTFVFPPYQVAGYADGTQQVDVPASILLPWVAPDLRSRLVVQDKP